LFVSVIIFRVSSIHQEEDVIALSPPPLDYVARFFRALVFRFAFFVVFFIVVSPRQKSVIFAAVVSLALLSIINQSENDLETNDFGIGSMSVQRTNEREDKQNTRIILCVT